MEGFNAAEVNRILNLEAENYNASVVVALGYRSSQDAAQHALKVRRPQEDLFETI